MSLNSVSSVITPSPESGGSRSILYLGDFRFVHSGKFGVDTNSTASIATFLSLV